MPNASLSALQAVLFLAWMCLMSFAISGFLAWRGYWLVMPFAGLEMLALAAGLYWALRDNAYREVITMDDDRLYVEAGRARPQRRWEMPRAWTRVLVEGDGHLRPIRLLLAHAGCRCEIGACLTDEEKNALADRLRQLLDPRHTARISERNTG
jgi:uncharacterized membrane protein